MIATNELGSFPKKYNGISNHIINMTVNIPSLGEVMTNSESVVEDGNSLNSFIIGSEGTMGVITESLLRIERLPEFRQWGII